MRGVGVGVDESESESGQLGRLERAFDEYLKARESAGEVELDLFLEGLPEDLREDLQTLVEDYHALRQVLRSGPDDFWPGCRIGDYTLVREIGRGGSGVVYEATDRRFDRRVAIKLLPQIESLTEAGLERFHREASAGGRLSHAAIVAVYDVGSEGQTNFIVEELVPGGRSLAQEIEELRRLDRLPSGHFRRLGAFFAKVAEGMAAAHAAGVVHRDLKPQNLLIDESLTPKIADFGLAALGEESASPARGGPQGTYFYMSPEQAQGSPAAREAATDIFSLGAVLYETLTLVRPFEGDTPEQILARVRDESVPDPRMVHSQVPRDLAVICMRALEKQPNRRYASMAEMAADLHRYLNGEALHARPPSRARVLIKWCRRHKAITSSTLLASTALVVLGMLLAETLEARRSADEALAVTVRLFQYLDPHQPRTEELGAILGRAEELAREDLVSRPLLRARLLAAIGFVERHEGLMAGAELALRQARRGLTANGGEWGEILAVNRALADILRADFRIDEAEELVLTALAETVRSDEREVPVELQVDLAGIFLARGDLLRLADFEAEYGDLRQLLERVLAEQVARLGARHLAVLQTRHTLGLYLSMMGKFDQARRELQRVQVALAVAAEPDHPLTVLVQSALAEVAVRSGRLVEAGHRYRMLDEQQGQLAGEGRHQPSRFLEDRAWVALYLDDLDEAARLFGELEAMAPQNGARAWRARRGQARLLEESGDLVAAGTLLQQVCAVAPEDSPERGEAELDRAVNLMLRDRPGEAIAMFEALLSWAPEPALPMAVEVRGLLAQALDGAGQRERAVLEQRTVVECLRDNLGPLEPRTVEAFGRLVVFARGTSAAPEVGADAQELIEALGPGALSLVLRLRVAEAATDDALVDEIVSAGRLTAPRHGQLAQCEMFPLRFALAEHDLVRGQRERASFWLRRVRLAIPVSWRATSYRVRSLALALRD